ncbi:ABC transporter permease [Pseudolactococcus hodotermopsidis]|uniref:ABC transporter permease n=1 Tax=Pseudolactococcus hodotermopsidis TaxID=2709157 RepID=UPI001556E517|nr:ABC transporter permease [Lactococcus hodotermopsidis]
MDFILGRGDGPTMTAAQQAKLMSYYNLDKSIWQQFLIYLRHLVQFKFGVSYLYQQPVIQLILTRLPYTLAVVGISIFFSFFIGVLLGLFVADKKETLRSKGIFIGMLTLSSLPEYLIGLLLVIPFCILLKWLPMSGAQTSFLENASIWSQIKDRLIHGILPVLALTLANVPSIFLIVRNQAREILKQPYIEFAEMKGLKHHRIIYRHVFRNILLPIFTLMMQRIAIILTGAIFVETLFSYPGIGLLLQESILSRDYPLMQGLFLIFALVILSINLLTDLYYPKLDPRIGGKNVEKI